MHFLYATQNDIKHTRMKKSSFFFILCLLLQFTLTTPGFSASKNSTARFNATLKQAKAGSPKAMFLVARMLERGKGIKKNINEASKWYQRSASQNYAAANARLGKLYLEGIGVNKNTKKAFSLLNLAAIQGIPVAQFNLAIVYELGIGTKRDLQEAIKWYDYAAKGGYYTAKSKSSDLKKQLGINSTTTINEPSSSVSNKTEPKNPSQQNFNETESEDKEPIENNDSIVLRKPDLTDINTPDTPNLTVAASDENNKTEDTDDEVSPLQDKVITTPEPDTQSSNNEKIVAQALLSNTADRTEIKPKNIPLKISKLSKKQKLALVKNQNIKRTLKTLLDGRWFDKNRPVNFLPSPKATCNIINQSDLKCTSRQLQRRTDRETIFYKTLGKISKLTSTGSFLIQYQNTVVRVVADKVVTDDGVLYQSNIKPGLQQKIHQLICQYKDITKLVCIKDGANKINFKNRAIVERTIETFE